MKKIAAIALALLLLMLDSHHVFSQDVYDARIGKKEILTPAPGKEPVINGPVLYGARPDKQFIYRIPCQGKRPIQFKVKGLPKGLSVDEEGIITGRTPGNAGEYKLQITATNKYGKARREFTLVIGDKIALTPPTGWNTWGGNMLIVSDKLIRDVTDFFVKKGLADVGFQYIGIDDCWMRLSRSMYEELPESKKKQHEGFDYAKVIGTPRDANGRILPNSFFPDMKGLADYVHSKGLKIGIYSSPGKVTCQRWTGSCGFEKQDADQYGEWGFDLLKYDLCSGGSILQDIRKKNPDFTQAEFWKPMVSYIEAQDRDILFNLCQYGQENPWEWAPAIGVETWRCTGDLNHHVENYFKSAMRLATDLAPYAKPGQWNDPDFMYIDHIRDHKHMFSDCVEIPLNTNQRYQYVTLWSMVCAPFVFSCNIEAMDEFTLRLLTNRNLMNISQDRLTDVADVVRNEDNAVVMVKNLADGSKALAVFNQDPEHEQTITVMWDEIGECCEKEVYDAWRMKDLGIFKGGINSMLSPDGVALYIIR